MEIVIKISEEQYDRIKFMNLLNDDRANYLRSIILGGTLLPKYHGRLIDADALKMDCGYSNYDGYYHTYSSEAIYHAPTIIEADKGSESE